MALTEEGKTNATFMGYAQKLEANMRVRQERWAATPYPYGYVAESREDGVQRQAPMGAPLSSSMLRVLYAGEVVLQYASGVPACRSEFGFDTTGQEEVVVWNLYFGNTAVAKKR